MATRRVPIAIGIEKQASGVSHKKTASLLSETAVLQELQLLLTE